MAINRALIFAHYDKDNVIDDYVIFYLKALRSFVQKIIFVSSDKILSDEIKKLDGICDNIICEKHNEYDFGSYKRGFLSINNIEEFDEIIFANDSCYGPFFPLDKVFEKMDKLNPDFWGITENCYDLKGHKFPHIQTYFFVLKKRVFTSESFNNFINSVSSENSKIAVINNYEIGLTKCLKDVGFIYKTYVDKYKNFKNPTISKWRELLNEGLSPFVKYSVLRGNNRNLTYTDDWENLFSKEEFQMINSNLKRYNSNLGKTVIPKSLKKIYYNFINIGFVPNWVRKIFSR